MRPLFLLLSVFLITSQAGAMVLPEIPNSPRILTTEEVKNFWVNRMPVPSAPSQLRSDYARANVGYHRQIGERHRLVQEIRAGRLDKEAKMAMLRHNIVAYRMHGKNDELLALSAELDTLERAELKDQQQMELERQAEMPRLTDAEADRLERLIAATERLAEAIENNGGVVPDNADDMVNEIIPFERDRDRGVSLISSLHREIGFFGSPIYFGQPFFNGHRDRRFSGKGISRPIQAEQVRGSDGVQRAQPARDSRRGVANPRQPQVQQPQVQQPQVRQPQSFKPQVRQPQVRQPQTTTPRVPQPQVRQPQSFKPQVRQPQARRPQARQTQPSRPQVRQPQVKRAR